MCTHTTLHVQEILGSCGVWVEVPSPETESNTITLRGPQEKLGQALTQVNCSRSAAIIITSLSPSLSHTHHHSHHTHTLKVYEKANSVVTEEVYAPRWLHRFIIGRKGQNVQMITKDLPKVPMAIVYDTGLGSHGDSMRILRSIDRSVCVT